MIGQDRTYRFEHLVNSHGIPDHIRSNIGQEFTAKAVRQSLEHIEVKTLFFYMKGDGWAVEASLPTNLQSNLGASVNLDMDNDKPYQHNAEHLKQYPKEKYKPGKIAKN